ncbi:uncharacterized protein LOC100115163 [Nasonia vitripennis]|uniref:Uncharacterized protein n=1 Tax=Nasonia vitripennis TaxID=7425 RepID=A0A7M7T8I6_NASVI|nr:uncharacterized protein LOC100115163 [Nasonia vitripennis]
MATIQSLLKRIDFVLKANQKIDNYWIRYRGLGSCRTRNSTTRVHQVSILRYESAELGDPKAPVGYDIPETPADARILNPHNKGTEDPMAVSIPLLRSIAKNDETSLRKPDHQFYIAYDFYVIDNYDFHRRHLYGFDQATANFFKIAYVNCTDI